ARRFELGLRACDLDIEVCRIDLEQHVATLDRLVVVDGRVRDRAGDTRRDRHDVGFDLRVVGRLLVVGQPPVHTPQGGDDHGDHAQDEICALTAARLWFGRCFHKLYSAEISTWAGVEVRCTRRNSSSGNTTTNENV